MSTQNLKQKVLHSLADETLEVLKRAMGGVLFIDAAYFQAPEMEQFFNYKLGISSRIAHRIDFPDCTINELLAIARIILEAQHYRFSSDAEAGFRDYLAQASMPDFANAQSVRNALEQARMRQANFLLARGGKSVNKIEAEDIVASRVFKDIPNCLLASVS